MSLILVKKSDGTQVRMTMEEFKLYKQSLKKNPQNNTNQTVVQKDEVEKILPSGEENTQPIIESVVQSNKDSEDEEVLWNESDQMREEPVLEKEDKTTPEELDLPMISSEHSLSNTAPVKDIFTDEAMYKKASKQEIKKTVVPQIEDTKKKNNNILDKWGSEDHKSLLEEDDEEVKKHHLYTVLPTNNNNLVNKILAQISFAIPQDLSGRLQSLILSRIKDIRTDDQILEYAMREKESGGLSFSQTEAGEIVQLINQHSHSPYKKEKLAKTEINLAQKTITADLSDSPKQSHSIAKSGAGKPILHDITLPQEKKTNSEMFSDNQISEDKKSVGPLDELRTFDLKDWRRLSNNPAKAGQELLEKFIVLKKDSFLSFIEAVTVWRQSPLYNMYKGIIANCIDNQQKVKDYLFNQDKNSVLSSEEFDELVKVNKNLV